MLAQATDRVRAAAGWGLLAGLLFFVPLLAWLRPFGFLPWLLLAALQAASVAVFVAVVAAWGQRRAWPAVAVVAWIALEVARSRWPLGGFGWGALGYTQHDAGLLLPIARLFGVFGVSAACAAVGVAVLVGFRAWRNGRRLRPLAGASAVLALIAAVSGVGAAVGAPAPTARTVDIAAVQGNDLERSGAAGVNRQDSGRIVAVAQAMLDATRPLASDPPDVTVWPENALDDDPRSSPEVGGAVAEALELLDGGSLVAGALVDGPRAGTGLNVAAEVVAGPRFEEVYVKRQPVPFAEYIPGRNFLTWFPPLQQIPIDILGAGDPVIITAAKAPLGIVICFENIFPGVVGDQVEAGAELLVVSTNNASFGRTAMSRQHLAFSQLRAVETGRYVLHAGISGISGVVDPRTGAVSQRTELYEQAIVRGDLPLVTGWTPYLRIRALIESAVLLGGLLIVVLLAVAQVRNRAVTES